MKNFLMSIIAFCAVVVIINGCDETSINPQQILNTSTAENVIFYNQIGSDGATSSVYRVNADGTGKFEIAKYGAIWSHSFKNKVAFSKLIGNTTHIIVANADGTDSSIIKEVNAPNIRCALSPDTMKVMYCLPTSSTTTEIHCMNIDGSGDILIAADAGKFAVPVFSPDGSRIAFLKQGSFYMQDSTVIDGAGDSIFIVNTDGSGRQLVGVGMYNHGYNTETIEWSPDGQTLVGLQKNGVNFKIMTMDVNSGDANVLNNTSAYLLSWSPDSERIVYMGAANNATVLKIINKDGSSEETISTSTPYFPQWSSDGDFIAFTELTKGNPQYGNLKVIHRNTSQIVTLDEDAFKGYWKK